MTTKDRILEKLNEAVDPVVRKALAALGEAGFHGKAEKKELGIRIVFPRLGRGDFIDIKNGTAFIKGSKGRGMQKALEGILPSKVIMG
jgi:hypothetical protein